MDMSAWSPAGHGHQRVWRFYCRISLENMPVQAWRKEAVQDAVGKSVWVDTG